MIIISIQVLQLVFFLAYFTLYTGIFLFVLIDNPYNVLESK